VKCMDGVQGVTVAKDPVGMVVVVSNDTIIDGGAIKTMLIWYPKKNIDFQSN
jgi:hypothetical protein